MKTSSVRYSIALVTAFFAANAIAQVPEIKEMTPGKYSYTIEVESPGMPMKMAPQKMDQCVTKEDIKGGKGLQAQKQAGVDCTYSNVKSSSPKYSFSAQCKMQGGMQMDADYDVTAAPGNITIVTKTKMKGGNIPPAMANSKTTMNMKRIGDC
jgi:hypothetical protein